MSSASQNQISNYTVAQIEDMAEVLGITGLRNAIRRNTAATYQEFLDTFYADLGQVLSIFQENPELRKDDGEDRLTIEIISMLRIMGYAASHDSKIGGHSDIVVRGRLNFLWIGEAKIHRSGYDYIFKGFQQLCTRYSTGDVNQDAGGLIVYVKRKHSTAILKAWRKHLAKAKLPGYVATDGVTRKQFEFDTKHIHERTKTPFFVRHIVVSLYFDPQDRDAKAINNSANTS